MFRNAAINCSAGLAGNDRDALVSVENRQVLIVADGAQGQQGGVAADMVVAYVKSHARTIADASSPRDCEQMLAGVDQAIVRSNCGGLTTAVLIVLRSDFIVGASVGDSEAHLVRQDDVMDLTAQQSRRPFLGSGSASPAGFGPIALEGRLLVATDGLFKYGAADLRERIVRTAPLHEVPSRLIESIRLRNGRLQDDVAVHVVGPGGLGRQGGGPAGPRSQSRVSQGQGSSLRNLKYMRGFAEAWPDRAIVQQLLHKVPWFHLCTLLDKVKDPAERKWYVRATIAHGWSRNVLVMQIETGACRRQGKALMNIWHFFDPPSGNPRKARTLTVNLKYPMPAYRRPVRRRGAR